MKTYKLKANDPRVLFFLVIVAVFLTIRYCNGQDPVRFKPAPVEYKWQNQAIKCALMAFAGAWDGVAEGSKYHYEAFTRKFPNHNKDFWGPQSWRNKYADGDPAQGPKFFGSTNVFVWTTDGYHMSRMIRNFSVCGAVVIDIGKKKPFVQYVVDFIGYLISYQIGFTLTYDIIIGK